MATGWPMKTTYANGDVYSAGDVNDITGTINLLGSSVAYAAGKNKIINGDYLINQRAFTTTTLNGVYTFDRWQTNNDGGTVTITPQTFTVGTAPVAGYEGKNFLQIAVASQTLQSQFASITQKIESVRTLANSTATVSFWAKASSGTPKVAVTFQQNFGTGGSPSASVQTIVGSPTLSTSWARYSVSVTVPSISGKTLGTNNNDCLTLMLFASLGTDNSSYGTIGLQNTTIQLWGVQVEQGATATAFQTATGTIQGELAACQRYYYRVDRAANSGYGFIGMGTSTPNVVFSVPAKSTMRSLISSVDFSNLSSYDLAGSVLNATSAVIYAAGSSTDAFSLQLNYSSGITQFRPYFLFSNTGSAGYIGFSAEL
jgi:hypothetical protein